MWLQEGAEQQLKHEGAKPGPLRERLPKQEPRGQLEKANKLNIVSKSVSEESSVVAPPALGVLWDHPQFSHFSSRALPQLWFSRLQTGPGTAWIKAGINILMS